MGQLYYIGEYNVASFPEGFVDSSSLVKGFGEFFFGLRRIVVQPD